MSLLGESHHLEAEDEHQEAPKELVITPPQPKRFIIYGNVPMAQQGPGASPPPTVIMGKKP